MSDDLTGPIERITPIRDAPGSYLAGIYQGFKEDCEKQAKRLTVRFPFIAKRMETQAYVWEAAADIAREFDKEPESIDPVKNATEAKPKTAPLIQQLLHTISILTASEDYIGESRNDGTEET